MGSSTTFYLHAIVILTIATTAFSFGLNPFYYDRVCPQALPTIKRLVQNAVNNERRMGASLLRLHFHDCFVNGCDASILLDASPTIVSEQDAIPNRNSIRGMDVIDQIKFEVDKVCRRSVVSCADILTVAARDSVVALGGPFWKVPLGRKDSTTASQSKANTDIPSPFLDLPALIKSFQKQGLDLTDLVALSGAHTIGFSKCALFKNRIYNETNVEPTFRRERQAQCPRIGGELNLAPLDPTPANFDVAYFRNLVIKKGLLHSDQVLFNGGSADGIVKRYALNPAAFNADFVKAMIKMGNIKPLTGFQGQVRLKCGKVN